MIFQSTMYQKQNIDLSSAPWTLHEFFAGSGLVAYGLRGMFAPVWANDISEQKAAVYEANFGCDRFILNDIKNIKGNDLPYAHLSWASFPCQDLSLVGSIGGIHASRSGLVWEWLRVLDEMDDKPKILLLENVAGLLSTNGGDNYRVLHLALVERGYRCGAVLLNASYFVPQSRPRVFIIAVQKDCPIPEELVGNGPCWLHNNAATQLGRKLPKWIWWYTEKPPRRIVSLKDIVEDDASFDKDDALRLVPERHWAKLRAHDTVYATGYRRTRNGKQQLELRFDGIAGCLRTPEGGRTSRGSMGLMIKSVDFLNAWNEQEAVDFSIVEDFWAEQVREYFRNQPFDLTADTSKTIGANLDDLFEQEKKRQKQNSGTQYLDTVLQHLVAAKLCLILPEGSFEIHGASVADGPTDRNGDFVIGNTVIHCTTMPGALLIEKCKANLRAGCHPVIITIFERVHTALNLAEDAGLARRVEVWDIQQFLSANVYEHSLFDESKRNSTLSGIIERYNKIVLEAETDPSLRIEFEAR